MCVNYLTNSTNDIVQRSNKKPEKEWMLRGRFSDATSIGNKCERENHQRSPFDICTKESRHSIDVATLSVNNSENSSGKWCNWNFKSKCM